MHNLLFYEKGRLADYLESIKSEIKNEIECLEKDYLLNVSEEDLVKHLIEKYSPVPPSIREDEIHVLEPSEVDIDVSGDPMRAIFDRNRPFYIKGTSVTMVIPFDGDGILFQYQPSTYTNAPPHGEIYGQKVHMIYKSTKHDDQELKREIERDIGEIKRYLGWIKENVSIFCRIFEPYIRESLKSRKEKLLKDMELVDKLGIPIKRSSDPPRTYAVPEIRRKAEIRRPVATEKHFKPEPTLEMKEYENILGILRNMVLVMERSPRAFKTMKEEALRHHFLVQLNAQYEGLATGETFNYEGKTDILIRYEGKNVFIAECKFWKGEKDLLKAIDQLLGYTSWRDTKTAILVFNRRQNFSAVLEKISSTVKSHQCYKREIESKEETEYRYTFHQLSDKNRELILTVMAFDIPG